MVGSETASAKQSGPTREGICGGPASLMGEAGAQLDWGREESGGRGKKAPRSQCPTLGQYCNGLGNWAFTKVEEKRESGE